MAPLELSAHMTVRPGCLEGFKKQAAELIRITQEKDTHTLRYDWFLSLDGTECEVREAYTGPEGLIEHNRHILDARTRLFKDYADHHFMTVYGEVSEPLLNLLEAHAAGHKWFSFFRGLEPSTGIPPQFLVAARDAKQPVAVSRRLKQAGILIVIIFAAAQLVRPGRANPTTDATRTIQAHVGTTSELVAVLDRSCRDCHSNNSVWPWYTHIAPLSWLMARGVAEGRKAVNFSEWASYPPDVQRTLLSVSCQDATSGKMPGPYTLLRPETTLSPQDIETICAAARQAGANAAEGGSH